MHGRITLSLSVALFFALLFFVVFADPHNYFGFDVNTSQCQAGGALLEYFFLASLTYAMTIPIINV
jgi:hypothetical protein